MTGLLIVGLCIGIVLLNVWPFLFPISEPIEPVHQGATEAYAAELAQMAVEARYDDEWYRTHMTLKSAEETARDGIADICTLAINMLNNDQWWEGRRYGSQRRVLLPSR